MGGVFINYRGDDSQTAAALIDRELAARFGNDLVFLDSRSIPVGMDFTEQLQERLRECSVLLVVIGPRWLTLTNEAGQLRIDDPQDWIRREIVGALSHGKRVIPVLTDGADLPAESELPEDMAALSRRQYVPLRHRYATTDLAYLAERIVEHEPELAAAAASRERGPWPIPRQLPAAPRFFTGRAEEFAMLTAALDEAGATVAISVIAGTGGIGKTCLALHWAHRHAVRFPDGQLFVDLRGFSPHGDPVPPSTALRGFLHALGVEPSAIPQDLDGQAGLYRSMVADRHILIVLDNVLDTNQVVPLLPGSAACTVLVTTRRQLAGLTTIHGARSLHLGVLSGPESRQLLADHLGSGRLAAEPDAVTELLACCAGLPLALCIVAARAAVRPSRLWALAEELLDRATRLDGLDAGELPLNLRSVFALSHAALSAKATTLFELLGLASGPDISLPAAGSLMAIPVTEVRLLLRELEAAHLLTQPASDRYRMHDLIRLYAGEQARQVQSEDAVTAARRLVDFYVQTAYVAERFLSPHRPPIELAPVAPGCRPHQLSDATASLAWLDAEYSCLLAAQQLAAERGWHKAVLQIAWSLSTFHFRRGRLDDNVTIWQVGLAAATRTGDPADLLMAHRHVGRACGDAGRHAEALHHLRAALELAENSGDLLVQAHTHHALAGTWERQGAYQRALDHATKALDGYRALDQPVCEADLLNMVGWYSIQLGKYPQAGIYCREALALQRRHSNHEGEANALDSLGYLAHRTGQYRQAVIYYRQALDRYRAIGDLHELASTLERLGHTYVALGENDEARRTWRQALELCESQRRVKDAHRMRRQLDTLAE